MFEIDRNKFEATYEAFLEVIHPDDRETVSNAVSDAVANKSEYIVEHRLLLKSGLEKRVLEQGVVKYNENGEPTSMIGTIQNITKIKKAQDELISLKNRAEASVRSKSQFLANMSHEIRTPLNAILGFINILKTEEENEKKLKYLDIVSDSSNSLLSIINDILDISKIENNKLDIELIAFEVKKEIDTLYELFSASADESLIQLKYFYSDNVPKYITGDSLRIKQVLVNLLSNAIKFTPEHGVVELHVDYSEEYLLFKVVDTGIGIEEEKFFQVFEEFSQADHSTSRKFGGTGLGLSISNKLSKLMGGELTLQSTIGKGSSFGFKVHAIESKSIGEDTKKETEYKLKGKILVAEDNKTNQLLVSILLEDLGLDYSIASNGKEAVEMCLEETFDLVLMDINMPVMNGIEAFEHLRQDEEILRKMSFIPVVALTANAIKGDREKYINLGMNGYISKPIDKDLFSKELAKFLKLA